MPASDPPFEVACPTCGRRTRWTPQQTWRPFCSERCKLIDLGEWLTEERRIPGTAAAPFEPPDES
ncbi:MAG: DNA gyrase inhibitor YacG [Chromatiaceae bacterium]|nr:DNA gyrase inhibitor YacG [Chromatiaceae bacterium]